MKFVIVDTKNDIEFKKKEFPYPMEYISEDDFYLNVKNRGIEEKIFKKNIFKINDIYISKKNFKEIK